MIVGNRAVVKARCLSHDHCASTRPFIHILVADDEAVVESAISTADRASTVGVVSGDPAHVSCKDTVDEGNTCLAIDCATVIRTFIFDEDGAIDFRIFRSARSEVDRATSEAIDSTPIAMKQAIVDPSPFAESVGLNTANRAPLAESLVVLEDRVAEGDVTFAVDCTATAYRVIICEPTGNDVRRFVCGLI